MTTTRVVKIVGWLLLYTALFTAWAEVSGLTELKMPWGLSLPVSFMSMYFCAGFGGTLLFVTSIMQDFKKIKKNLEIERAEYDRLAQLMQEARKKEPSPEQAAEIRSSFTGGETENLTTVATELKEQLTAPKDKKAKRDNSAANLAKGRRDLQSWQDALPLVVSATVKILAEEATKRSRQDLFAFVCVACGKECKKVKPPCASLSNTQFESWRGALPPEHVDQEDRSAYPQNTVETFTGEGDPEKE